MSEGSEQLFKALAGLVGAGTKALESYTQLQEKRAKYLDEANNPASPTQAPQDAAFEQFQPGYFEKAYGPKRAE